MTPDEFRERVRDADGLRAWLEREQGVDAERVSVRVADREGALLASWEAAQPAGALMLVLRGYPRRRTNDPRGRAAPEVP